MDDVDTTQARSELEEKLIAKAIRYEIEPGLSGICSMCDMPSKRLVRGVCSPCRDEFKLK